MTSDCDIPPIGLGLGLMEAGWINFWVLDDNFVDFGGRGGVLSQNGVRRGVLVDFGSFLPIFGVRPPVHFRIVKKPVIRKKQYVSAQKRVLKFQFCVLARFFDPIFQKKHCLSE